jgi:hypothetical protein
MCKSELYRQILGTVSQETEISEERILSKAKNAEIVDARYLLVYFLWRQGFHAPVISSLMNFSRRPIEKMISQFDLRRKQSGKMFEMLLVRIARPNSVPPATDTIDSPIIHVDFCIVSSTAASAERTQQCKSLKQ